MASIPAKSCRGVNARLEPQREMMPANASRMRNGFEVWTFLRRGDVATAYHSFRFGSFPRHALSRDGPDQLPLPEFSNRIISITNQDPNLN